jgi:hypothetical protein
LLASVLLSPFCRKSEIKTETNIMKKKIKIEKSVTSVPDRVKRGLEDIWATCLRKLSRFNMYLAIQKIIYNIPK